MDRREFLRLCKVELRQIAISLAVGVAVGVIYWSGHGEESAVTLAIAGAFVGFCIYLVINALSFGFDRYLRLASPPYARLAEGTKYVVGGIGGWMIGVAIVNGVLGGRFAVPVSAPAQIFMLIVAAVALGVGLLFRSFESLHARLRQREWAERELEIARSIQLRLLPPAEIAGEGFTVTGRNLAAHYVAGDFYDVVKLADGSVMIILADVAGKGIGAGLIMSSVKAVLPFVARGGVGATMTALNQKLSKELGKREFVALMCARYQPRTGLLEVANGGCPDPYLITANGVDALTCDGIRLPLGLNRDVEYSIATRTIEPGGRLLMLSDGIPEAPTGNGQPLGYDAVEQILADLSAVPDRGLAWIDRLVGEVMKRVGNDLSDDWTALTLERAAA